MSLTEYSFDQQSLGHILADKANTIGQRPFLQYEDNPPVTFSEVNDTACRVAAGLQRLGLLPGDKVATFLPNLPEAVYAWFGICTGGMVDVPVNLANKGDFLSHIINNSDTKAIFTTPNLMDRIKFIEPDLHQLKHIIVIRSTINEPVPEFYSNVVRYENLIDSPQISKAADVKGSDPQMILYTSGTTGPSKGATQPHRGIYLGAREYTWAIRANENDVFFTCLPVFHGNARVTCIYPALLLGSRVVIREKFSASHFWDWVRAAGATVFNTVGAMSYFIYNQPRKSNDIDNPVRVCAAFPMPAAIYDDFEKRFNLKVVEGYGLSEMGNILYNPYEAPKIGSCGKETPTFEVKIVDEYDFPVPAGQVGEIVARGRVPWTMSLGYYNVPEKTVEFTRNHYYHTGDLGYMDNEGYVFFVDRKKDYIRRRGENISSFEVERSVNAHPKVTESAAISIKSELSEDEVKVVVVLKSGEALKPEELLDFCQQRMPHFAVPRYVEFVTSLPKTPTDRVQKNLLRESGITPDTWDREKAGYKVNR